jgi:hypothetical protein
VIAEGRERKAEEKIDATRVTPIAGGEEKHPGLSSTIL